MNPSIPTIFAAAAWLAAAQTAAAQAAEKTKDLTPFTTLEVKGCFDTTLAPGMPERVVVRATPEQLALISIEQSDDDVLIEPLSDERALCRGEPITVYVTASFAADEDVEILAEGSGDLDADVPAADELRVKVDGSGDVTLEGSAANCEIALDGSGDLLARSLTCAKDTSAELRGSGSMTLRGETKACALELNGSGDIDASGYACESAAVKMDGSGSVDLGEVKELDVEIRGSGDVTYRGEPDRRRMDIKGSGNVRQL